MSYSACSLLPFRGTRRQRTVAQMARAARHGDPANKRLFSHRRMAADLIRLLGDDWIDRLERLPAEHVTESLRRRFADMPWWAPLGAGRGPPGAGALFH